MSRQHPHLARPLVLLTAATTALGGLTALGPPAAAADTSSSVTSSSSITTSSSVDDATLRGANRFSYAGSWQVCRGCRSDSYAGAFHYTNRRGAAVRLSFVGTRAVLYGLVQPAGGIATVTVDGRSRGTVNLAARRAAVKAVYATPTLGQGAHVVVLTVSARSSGRGRTIAVDRAVVSTVTKAPRPTTKPPTTAPPTSPPATTPPATTPPATTPPTSRPPQPPAGGSPGGVASVTFDDGQLGQFTNAAPVLRAAGFPGTFYVISDAMGWGGSSMSASQVGQLAAEGNEIGSHTRDHAHLTGLSAAQVEAEFADSVAALRDKAGVTPTTCAYPYGDANATVEAIAAKYFTACRGTGSGTNGSGADAYNLRVFYVHTSTSAADVRAAADDARAAGAWIIFVYHGVGAVNSADDVTTDQLSSHVSALKASGISVQTVARARAGR